MRPAPSSFRAAGSSPSVPRIVAPPRWGRGRSQDVGLKGLSGTTWRGGGKGRRGHLRAARAWATLGAEPGAYKGGPSKPAQQRNAPGAPSFGKGSLGRLG